MVAKQAVMDTTTNDGRTLRSTVCQDFGKENTATGYDFTAAKVHWLSKIDSSKRTGSMVVWLKNKASADYLLNAGTAIFGATGAYCSRWERREDDLPCFNCNRYGHKQASCKTATKCALCSGGHSRHNCPRPTALKCPACSKEGHSVFDWQCQLNPSHWKYVGIQRAKRAGESSSTAPQPRSRPSTTTASATETTQSPNTGESTPSSTVEATSVHEVNMTDAAETYTRNE
jgi:hypothetical protein